jgi:hypothetical protein
VSGFSPDAAWTMRHELRDVVWVRTSRWLEACDGAGLGVTDVWMAVRGEVSGH